MANFLDNFTVVGSIAKGATKAAESVDTDAAINAAIGSASQAVQEGNKLFRAGLEKANKLAAQAGAAVSNVEIISPELRESLEKRPSPTGIASVNIPDIPDPLGALQDTAQQVGEAGLDKLKVGVDYLQMARTTPVALMIDDIFVPNLGRKITEDTFSPEALEILRQMALDANLKEGDELAIDYNDFNKYGAELSARLVSGDNEDIEGIKAKLLNLTPADEVKMSLGEAVISVDQEGNIKITDQYDFNNWVWFGKGPDSKGVYPDLSADEFEKALEDGEITFTEAMLDSIRNAPSDYQLARNMAFLFGSRDYLDDTRDTGRKVEINLGKIN